MKRRKHLSGTAAEHATDFAHARQDVMDEAQAALLAVENGNCAAASAHLDHTNQAIGRMGANAYEGAELAEAARLQHEVANIATPIKQKCLRKEPVTETYARSMAAMRPGLAAPRAENWDEYLDVMVSKAPSAAREDDLVEFDDTLETINTFSPKGFRPTSRAELEAFRRDLDAREALREQAEKELRAAAKSGSAAARKRLLQLKNAQEAEAINTELAKLRIDLGFQMPQYVGGKRFVRRVGGKLQGVAGGRARSGPFRRR